MLGSHPLPRATTGSPPRLPPSRPRRHPPALPPWPRGCGPPSPPPCAARRPLAPPRPSAPARSRAAAPKHPCQGVPAPPWPLRPRARALPAAARACTNPLQRLRPPLVRGSPPAIAAPPRCAGFPATRPAGSARLPACRLRSPLGRLPAPPATRPAWPAAGSALPRRSSLLGSCSRQPVQKGGRLRQKSKRKRKVCASGCPASQKKEKNLLDRKSEKTPVVPACTRIRLSPPGPAAPDRPCLPASTPGRLGSRPPVGSDARPVGSSRLAHRSTARRLQPVGGCAGCKPTAGFHRQPPSRLPQTM